MKSKKEQGKKQRMIKHREEIYLQAINKVIDGKAEPGYATERFNKLKEVKGKGKL